MSTFTAAPGATGGQPAWVRNACARGSEETTPQGGGVGVDFIPTAEHAAGSMYGLLLASARCVRGVTIP